MSPIIHQALHGYSDGHRLISSSLPLSGADARTMVVMSDLSGPGAKPESSGYLTGYPLEGAGKYILARTWAAPEMPRPGCVWTHSLIIDNADLAAMTSPDDLLSAFRRPAGLVTKSVYSEPANVSAAFPRPFSVPMDRVRSIVSALYVAPERSILAEAERAEDDDRLVTAIWMQQWPRLRRSFGFCTLAGMDRLEKGVALDLQFVRSLDRQSRARFPHAAIPSEIAAEPALELLVLDLDGREESEIREFLRRVGGDVDGGRRAMLPLCQLYSALFNGAPDLSAAVNALTRLDQLGTRQARSIRTMVARMALEDVHHLEDTVFDFVIEMLEQGALATDKQIATDRVGLEIWRRSPVRFVAAVDGGGAIGRALEGALENVAAQELVLGLQENPLLAPSIVRRRPDLFERVDFWSIPNIDEKLLSVLDVANAGRVAIALASAGKVRQAPLLVARSEPEYLAAALNVSASDSVLAAWAMALVGHPQKTAAVLASGRLAHRSVVVALARAAHPDVVQNDFGEDPWLIAVRATARMPVEQTGEDYLSAFLMSRALGWRSKSQAELISFAYTTLYQALRHNRLSDEAERMVAWRLDGGGWFGGDNLSRLRETVVSRFVDRSLDPGTFGRLTDDGELAFALFDEAARTVRGRRYLDEVRKQLKSDPKKSNKARAAYIAAKIK